MAFEFDLAVIDADPLLYEIGFSCEHKRFTLTDKDGNPVFGYRIKQKNHPRRWQVWDISKLHECKTKQECHDYADKLWPGCEREEHNHLEPIEKAIDALKGKIESIHRASGAQAYTLYLSGGENFRIKRATLVEYKVSRKNIPKPKHYKALREWMIEQEAVQREAYEADDLVSMMLWKFKGRVILCTIDKDLQMVPGDHYNWQKHTKHFNGRIFVTPRMGALNLFKQLLMGDKVDDIPGLSGTHKNPGIGEKGAEELLVNCHSINQMWFVCLNEYYEAFTSGKHHLYNNDCNLTPEEAMQENLELLWMLKSVTDVGDITLEKLERYYDL